VQIKAVKNKINKKKHTETSGKLIKAVYVSYVYVYVFLYKLGRLEHNSLFVGLWSWVVRGSKRKIDSALLL